ncbi:response receiver-modulated cyclic diguanylate phosphodiesterase [Citrifermentans bemidjiense Bem]|uniref:Response receiver-modulated cyclic diguanylate phosphodiesterase n=1 Tax=Citrifermentans bemidjiense (strain ATCC BAA-1014 / DSM 16622 / JCM 12645 / Bem) TaxID=404380 RepID=B5EFV2_CITBB|nr:HD domain-containing phosphohydrolase [Citrifermentans bemidjiense]ACH39417.1 response receiver-modulated cyclic diguanylate phosphodiesterase [Citrifermentans bemidjiense Bem]
MKGNILIADDEDMIRELINITLSKEGFTCFQAASAEEGLEIINKHKLDLALLDIMMPGRSGIDLLKDIKEATPDTTVLMITAMNDMDTALSCIHYGAEDYITKPFNLDRVLLTVKNTLEKRRLVLENKEYQANLEQKVREQTEVIRTVMGEINLAYEHTLVALIRALDAREKEVGSHSERVMSYARLLAKAAGISEDELIIIGKGALLHDIGKIGVSDNILLKPAKLDDSEWEIMRQHPSIGFDILSGIRYFAGAAELVLHHHERWDGNGYPGNLEGENIPISARIFALVDTLDAMTSDRPYRKALTFEAVLDEVTRCRSKQFDPELVDLFLSIPKDEWESAAGKKL